VSLIEASVIVPHYNDLEGLDSCLAALEQQSFPRDRFEIIVADNASPCGPDAVRAVVGDRARVVFVHEKGAGPARNGGVAASTGEILAFTDSDCTPDADWLASGIARLADAGFVGGRMVVSLPRRTLTPPEAFEAVFAFDNQFYVERKAFTVTANLFVRRADFLAVGPFRTNVSEDQDWCMRARAHGLVIAYAHAAVVYHPPRHSWEELFSKWRRVIAEQHAITVERTGGLLIWLARTWLVLPSIPVHAIQILGSKRLQTRPDRMAALHGLVRLRLWRFVQAHRVMLRQDNR